MTSEQAAAIAYLVISRSQDDRDEHAGDKSSISFAEYMQAALALCARARVRAAPGSACVRIRGGVRDCAQAMEGNYMIPFDEFKCMVTKFCNRRGYSSNPTCAPSLTHARVAVYALCS